MMPSIAAAVCQAVAGGDPAHLEAIRRLNRDLATANDRIEELKELLGLKVAAPAALGLTPQMTQMFGAILAARGVVTIETLQTLLFGDRLDCDWPANPRRVVFVQMTRLRSRLGDKGIEIGSHLTIDGARGYFMSQDNKSKANALIRQSNLNDVHRADQPSRDCAPPAAQPLRGGGVSLPLGQAS